MANEAIECNGYHNFFDILKDKRPFNEEYVIRWCKRCGAIIGDIDVDGRTFPGRYFKIILPDISEK